MSVKLNFNKKLYIKILDKIQRLEMSIIKEMLKEIVKRHV